MGDIVQLDCDTVLPIPPENVLNGALAANLETVIVIGSGPDGIYHASSTSSIPDMLFAVEMFKQSILERAAG